MKKTLLNIGIQEFDGSIYEYGPLIIDWWDPECKMDVEIEAYEFSDFVEFKIFFSPSLEGIVERSLVLLISYKGNEIVNPSFVAKVVFEELELALELNFKDSNNAYLLENFSDAEDVLKRIIEILSLKQPNLHFTADDNSIENEYYINEFENTLEHFLAMMDMNSMLFDQKNIIENIELGFEIEGEKYIDTLKSEVESDLIHDFSKVFNINAEKLKFIKDIIIDYLNTN